LALAVLVGEEARELGPNSGSRVTQPVDTEGDTLDDCDGGF